MPTRVAAGRQPFDVEALTAVEALRPQVVSFHFGLPDAPLLDRVKATGAFVLSSATTVAEARWLQARGVDAIVAQGGEAGGHRGMFLGTDVDAQVGTLSLVPQIVDAVDVPVIAAGGIADGRGLAAALMLGAAAVQVGTAFLRSPEARTSPAHRAALATSTDDATRVTNVFTGRPARGLLNRLMRELGPMSSEAIAFPYAGSLLAALREYDPGGEFVPLWAGQSAPLAKAVGAEQIARGMLDDALAMLRGSGASSASWTGKSA
jgi:nitronate monooxygenase